MRSCILRSLLYSRKILRESFAKNKETLTYSQLKQSRQFSNDLKKEFSEAERIDAQKNEDHNLTASMNTKYKVFHDEEADVILDVTEEQHKIDLELLTQQQQVHDPYAGINLERGTTGVYEIEDLITLLELNKAKQIFVASVPKEYAYVDYIVVVTGASVKHMRALITFVRKVYKLKRHNTDRLPKIEGEMSNDWIAIDLGIETYRDVYRTVNHCCKINTTCVIGNIALHVFSAASREHYDLETLWTVGSQYDDKSKLTEEKDIMEQYNTFLAEFEPQENK